MASSAQTVVSILTPSYGYGHFIEDAILSVRHQVGAVLIEHVVQDAQSTDGTIDVLKRCSNVIWRSEPDDGQSDALNRALALSSGAIVGWLNADEFYLDGAVEKALQIFETTDADVVYGDSAFVDEAGNLMRLVPQHRFDSFVLRHYGCFIPSCAFFVRRSALDPKPWDASCRYIMDWDLYLRLLKNGSKFHYLPEALGAFRVHGARVTASPLEENADERLRVRRRYALPQSALRRKLVHRLARWRHTQLKLASGAYRRQWRWERTRGASMKWWPNPSSDSG